MDIHKGNLPKQARALLEGAEKVETYEATGGGVTAEAAVHNLTLLPSIPAGSVVHDNGCGAGTVTRLLLSPSSGTPTDAKIYATDMDQIFLDKLQQDVSQHNWPVEVSNQKSEALSFADNFFDCSIANFAIFFTSNAGLDGAKEIYRTLKPGGTAVVNCWATIPWLGPILKTHMRFRNGKPYPAPPINWSDGQQIQKVIREAGFAEGKMRVEKSEACARCAESEVRAWAERSWAFLAGIGGWYDEDEEKWDEEVDFLKSELLKADGIKVEGGKVEMKASQWVVIAEK